MCVTEDQKRLLKLLTPRSADILYAIGNAFYKRFGAKLKITGLNRNHIYVKALRKKNGNAARESSHERGTTFDISYLQVIPCDNQFFIPLEQREFLENLFFKLQEKGIIFATKERKKSCYHICVCPECEALVEDLG